ncbi:hypothetical protein [Cellulomonas endophytica]|uniref:hypothetical protein n=1 Tax=Cellulomonas endophytica TaxID=2494735 RepID=UPI001010470A|nr:hypothetical protein [Cellulomonas endophytica]
MRATLMHAAGDVRVVDVPDPVLQEPTDALVRVTYARRVFDRELPLSEIAEAYRLMHLREALKVLLRP